MKKLLALLLFLFSLTASARATDVAIGPSTIPGFNAANLPPDVTVTPVSVVNGSPTVTCASCFRQQWVGLGGFRITINTVPYTVAYVASRSSLTLTTNYAAGDSPSASILWYKYVELRVYADSSFQPLGKTYVVQPGAPGSGAWHRRVAASVVNELGVNNLYIPQLVLDATTDSLTNQAARYTAAFYRPEGSLIQFYDCFESFLLAPTGATTWPDICMFNTRQVIVQDDSTYTKTQIDAMRTGCTTGQGLFYASTGLKPACLNFGTGLTLTGDTLTATAPSGYTTIGNNGAPLTQRNTLNFVAPAFIASDNGGSSRTDVTAHGNLISLANLASNGGIYRTAANTLTARTITGTLNRVNVVDGDGVLGNPAIDVGSTVATSGSTLNFFAATTSAQLAGVISDESGSGALLFGTSPAITTPTITSPRIVTAINDSNGNSLFNLTATASAVNGFNAANAAAGNRPALATIGGDANIDFLVAPKGTGSFRSSGNVEVNKATPVVRFFDTGGSTAFNIQYNGTAFTVDDSTGATTPLSIDRATDVTTFNQIPVGPNANPTTDNQLARKKYVDDKLVPFSLAWFIDDPNSLSLNTDDPSFPLFRVPVITGGFLSKITILRTGGTHTTGGTCTFQARIFNGSTLGSGVSFSNTNNLANTPYTEDFADVSISEGNFLLFHITARSGTVDERRISINIEGYRKVQ